MKKYYIVIRRLTSRNPRKTNFFPENITGFRIDPHAFTHFDSLADAREELKRRERGGILHAIYEIHVISENRHIVTATLYP